LEDGLGDATGDALIDQFPHCPDGAHDDVIKTILKQVWGPPHWQEVHHLIVHATPPRMAPCR
jgi:hypothetical protein